MCKIRKYGGFSQCWSQISSIMRLYLEFANKNNYTCRRLFHQHLQAVSITTDLQPSSGRGSLPNQVGLFYCEETISMIKIKFLWSTQMRWGYSPIAPPFPPPMQPRKLIGICNLHISINKVYVYTVLYTVHVISQNIDGGASAPVGPSVAMPLIL